MSCIESPYTTPARIPAISRPGFRVGTESPMVYLVYKHLRSHYDVNSSARHGPVVLVGLPRVFGVDSDPADGVSLTYSWYPNAHP